MAQWKRAGSITQRSDEQNLAVLVIVLSIKLFKGRLLPIFLFFLPIKLKKTYAIHTKHLRTRLKSQFREGSDVLG